MKTSSRLFLTALSLSVVAACSDDGVIAPTNLSGQIVKGPVSGASVCAYQSTSGAKGAAIGSCVTTDASGNYSFPQITGYSGDIIIEASGGTYTNEATGAKNVPLGTTTPLKAVVASGGTVVGVVTPLTTVAYTTSTAPTSAAFNTALANVAAQAGITLAASQSLLSTYPTFAANATTATNAYAAALGGFAQYIQTANVSLAAALAAWTPANQAAFQSALSAYASAAGVASTALPTAYNFSAVAVAASTATGATVTTPTSSVGVGLVATSGIVVTGGSGGFAPLAGTGFTTAGITTITFITLAGANVQTLTATVDGANTVLTYVEAPLANPAGAKAWEYNCKTGCSAKVSINTATKTLTLNNVSLAPDTGATGTVTVNGSASYQ